MWLAVDTAFHSRPTRDFFEAVVKNQGWKNPFHPVCGYLNGLA